MKNTNSSSDIFGKNRLALGLKVSAILKRKTCEWFIEKGTLLGAVRSASLIKEDDNFGIAIILRCQREEVPEALKEMNEHLSLHLPSPYESRVVSGYADKIEVYDPSHGSYILPDPRYEGADFHHVTVDLQVYLEYENTIASLYHIYKFASPSHHLDDVLPFKSVELEEYLFNAPNNYTLFLKKVYGSISENAKYNADTGKYEEN